MTFDDELVDVGGVARIDDFAMRDFTVAQADDLYDYAASAIMPT